MDEKDFKKAFGAFDIAFPLVLVLLFGSGEWSGQGHQLVERFKLIQTVFVTRAKAFYRHDFTVIAREMHNALQKLIVLCIGLATFGMFRAFGNCGPVDLPLWLTLLPLGGMLILVPGRLRIMRDAAIKLIPSSLTLGRGPEEMLFRDFTDAQRQAEIAALGLRTNAQINNDPRYNTSAAETDPTLKAQKRELDREAKANERAQNRLQVEELWTRSPFRPLLTPDELDAQLLDIGADVAIDASPVPHLVWMIVEAFAVSLYILFCADSLGNHSYHMTGVSPAALYLVWLPGLLAAILGCLAFRLVFGGGTKLIQLMATVPARPINSLYHAIAAIPWGITFANAGEYVGSYTGQMATLLFVNTDAQVSRFTTTYMTFYLVSGMPVHWYSAFVAVIVGAAVGILHRNLESVGVSTDERRKKGAERLTKAIMVIMTVQLVAIGVVLFARNFFIGVLVFLVTQVNIALHFGHMETYRGATDFATLGNIFWRVIQVLGAVVVLAVAASVIRGKDPKWFERWGGRVVAVLAAAFLLNTFFPIPTVSAENLGIRSWLACPVPMGTESNVSTSKPTVMPLPLDPRLPPLPSPPDVTPPPAPTVTPAPVPVGIGAPSAERLARLERRRNRNRRHDSGDGLLATGVEDGPGSLDGTVPCSSIRNVETREQVRSFGGCH